MANRRNQLRTWRHRVNKKLVTLASILPNFKSLKKLSLEASGEEDDALGPTGDYLFGSTLEKFVQALPTSLKNLTLDICGSTLVKSECDRTPVHLCSLVALRLKDFETVRLRLRHICPQIFDNQSDILSKLSSLVIRLSLPVFPKASYEEHNGHDECDAQKCPSASEKLWRLHDPMVTAGTKFAETMGLEVMRITYRSPEISDVYAHIADCVRESV